MVALLGVIDIVLFDDMVDALAAGDAFGVYGVVDSVVEVGYDLCCFVVDLFDWFCDFILFDVVFDVVMCGLIEALQDEVICMVDQASWIGGAIFICYVEIIYIALIEMRGTTFLCFVLELFCVRMQLLDVLVDAVVLLQCVEWLECCLMVFGEVESV